MSTPNRGINIGPPRFKIAVHSIFWLAKSNSILSSAMIASQVDSHATFLRRVMQSLTAAGIVESKSGREGGYTLRKSIDQITLGEIYSAVSVEPAEPEAGVSCAKVGEQLNDELDKILYEAEQETIDHLRQYTIADVMDRLDDFMT